MTKHLFSLLFITFISLAAKAETSSNDFESELRFLEKKEIVQEEKAEALVEKMSAQNNSTRENDLITDSVSTKDAATTKLKTPPGDVSPLELAPNSQESMNNTMKNTMNNKKIRRIPSR